MKNTKVEKKQAVILDPDIWHQEMKKALASNDEARVIELWYGENGGKYTNEIGKN